MSDTKAYSEFSFYSPIFDSECLRISVGDGRTGEYFAIIAKPSMGKSLIKARENALNAIESYIDSGFPPGEVIVKESSLG